MNQFPRIHQGLNTLRSGQQFCTECDNGQVEHAPNCFKPISECCGGCFTYEQCETCDGTGVVEVEN